MDSISEMALFARVVEANGFKAAAVQAGLSPSAVSKRITRLEDRLGARLLHRTTRRLGLTEVGSAYYEQCRRILEDIDEAERKVSDTVASPRGLLRVSVPVSFGQARLAPLLPEFLSLYPEVRISVLAVDREVDLIDEGLDMAIRVARLRDSTMIARRLTANRRVVCATPGYFERHGVPDNPEALGGHNCLVNMAYSPHRTWSFNKDGRHHAVHVEGNLDFSSPQALREAALRGLGIVLLPSYLVEGDLRSGVLREVMPDFISEDPDVYAVYPHSPHLSPKVRVFIDYLAERFQARA